MSANNSEKFTDCQAGKKKRKENPKHLLLAKNLIKNNFNQTKAYQETYNTNYETANGNANNHIVKYGIVDKAIDILESDEILNDKALLLSFTEDLTSLKPIATKNGLEFHRDNANILRAKELLLKVKGLLGKDTANSNTYIDNRSITTADSETLLRIIKEVKELNAQAEKDQEAMKDWKPA